MEAVAIRNLTFFYPEQAEAALESVSLVVEKGEFVVLCGKSGCGKTTLLRQLKSTLAPHGTRRGEVLIDGTLLEQLNRRIQSERIGFVLQSPDNQIVTDKVWHELAFGLESLGYDTPTIRLRVAEMASFFGIQNWFHKDVAQLSGGQKQLLNLASVMTLQPEILLLDEPTSQLDPIAAAEFLAAVSKINRELGVTVLLSEHRLEEALPLADRCVVMDGGKIVADGTPKETGMILRERHHAMFDSMPAPMRVWAGVPEGGENCPITVREGRAWLGEYLRNHRPCAPLSHETDYFAEHPCAIHCDNLWFRYEQESADVVKGLNLTIKSGELFAIVGGNGTGKTTALSLLSGLNKPGRGELRINGSLGVLPQNPQSLFLKKTVESDLGDALRSSGQTTAQKKEKICAMAALCDLPSGLLQRHPYDLSGGEQQRVALAKILLLEPDILLLDEPTKGLDSHFKAKLAHILKRLTAGGCTVVLVSHDVEFCAAYADRCALFFDGAVVTEGVPRTFFAGNSFYTTAAERMARDLVPGAVTAEDVITALGGTVKKPEIIPPPYCATRQVPRKAEEPTLHPPRSNLSKRTLVAAIMILLLIPVTLFVGVFYLGQRKYYFISLLIVLETMLPFFLVFEGRKPQARELVVIATLCAIAVAGRAAFFFIPQFKPVAAIVIIVAVAFGGESGFLVGAVSMLASNLFFGQGPWTPFQMFAMGIIGFLAGILFRKGVLGRNRLALCVYGGFTTFFIYGFIMNTYSVVQVQAHVTWEMIWASCIVGIPMDFIHALSTIVFLAVAGPTILEKLDRIKVKYGLMEQ